MRKRANLLCLLWLSILLAGCATQSQEAFQAGRYHLDEDSHVLNIDVSHIPDAVPRPPDGLIKSKPYRFNNRSYTPLPLAAGYVETGMASWYGAKFHGYHTANGEIYDMYAMTAAHKTLPLPSYARVTNLNNGRSIIVRINDRGPFHNDRLIDLSWAAAARLGYLDRGTARVKIEGIDTSPAGLKAFHQKNSKQKSVKKTATDSKQIYLQIAALSNPGGAHALRQKLLAAVDNHDIQIVPVNNKIFRVRIGPIDSDQALSAVQESLKGSSWWPGQKILE